jgi:hypothetical protein
MTENVDNAPAGMEEDIEDVQKGNDQDQDQQQDQESKLDQAKVNEVCVVQQCSQDVLWCAGTVSTCTIWQICCDLQVTNTTAH